MSKEMTVAVVGSGVMGQGIVQTLAQAPSIQFISWKGRTEGRISDVMLNLEARWKKLVEKNIFTSEQVTGFFRKIRPIYNYSDLMDAKCIIESVKEDIDVKKEVIKHISACIQKGAIFASNTSSLSITELSLLTPHPENFIGMHFFNPAPVMKLTEVVLGAKTSQETLAWTQSFLKALDKEPVLVKEAPGFIVNRILIPMLNEAVCLLVEGVASENEIDKAMCLGANHPIGPLALADVIGIDVVLSIMDILYAETGDTKYRAHPLLRKMVRANELGRKTKKGFYAY